MPAYYKLAVAVDLSLESGHRVDSLSFAPLGKLIRTSDGNRSHLPGWHYSNPPAVVREAHACGLITITPAPFLLAVAVDSLID
jgi:hypothetical protein